LPARVKVADSVFGLPSALPMLPLCLHRAASGSASTIEDLAVAVRESVTACLR